MYDKKLQTYQKMKYTKIDTKINITIMLTFRAPRSAERGYSGARPVQSLWRKSNR